MSSESSAVPRIKVVVQCTSGSQPAGFVADLRQVIELHNAGDAKIPSKCQPPPPVESNQEVTQEETHQCWMAAKMSLRVHTACLGPALSAGHQCS
eukprot:Em0129g13a